MALGRDAESSPLTMRGLPGEVALVTGGARGIGRAIVERLVAEEVDVAFLDRDRVAGEETARATGARFIACDVTDEPRVEAALRSVLDAQGPTGILVNNAGVNAYADATEMTMREWEQVFAVDLKASWLCAKYAIPQMRRRHGGSIVNIASIHAFMTTRGMFPYAAAKAGVIGLTRSLALDHAEHGIRVNAVCPGWVRTHLVQEWIDLQPDPVEAERAVLAVHPLGRIGTPAEIAGLVAFLASADASFITGAAMLVDGGLSARYAV